jgi:hypothetical protein
MSRPALGPNQPRNQWVSGVLSARVKRGRGLTLTTHPHLVALSRMSSSYTSSPPKRLHCLLRDCFACFLSCHTVLFTRFYILSIQQPFTQSLLVSAIRVSALHGHRHWLTHIYTCVYSVIYVLIKSVALQALTNLGRLSSRRWQSFPTAPYGTGLTCG